MKKIEDGVFSEHSLRKEVSFQGRSALEEIGSFAFHGSSIEEFYAPDSLRKIGSGAFSSCKNLRAVKLNKGL